MPLNTIPELIDAMRQGELIILMDDEERENEGDLVVAAPRVTPEAINFMVRYGRGLVCLPMTRERCERLHLPLMVQDNHTRFGTRFTVSIEAAHGVTTGISAHDRAHTILAAVAPDAQPQDIVQPGHVFPIMAQPGGVLTRAGHTEASSDLARLAGFEPAAVIVEILNEDGRVARRPDLERFASRHGLRIGTIADLIRYRMEREMTVARVLEKQVQTEFGPFELVAYEDHFEQSLHFAFKRGPVDPERPVLVRVHVENSLADLLHLSGPGLGWPLTDAFRVIAREGGTLVILRPAQEAATLIRGLDLGAPDDLQANSQTVLRTYGVGAQILRDLGIRKMCVMSAPKLMLGLSGFGLEVSEYRSGETA
ncbi:MAG: bifunctional 3,4-dihydroxy-2-butanone-4-phosphate synthase/GTP cyclohydrolase II [Gammaproteobacteria bacterium]